MKYVYRGQNKLVRLSAAGFIAILAHQLFEITLVQNQLSIGLFQWVVIATGAGMTLKNYDVKKESEEISDEKKSPVFKIIVGLLIFFFILVVIVVGYLFIKIKSLNDSVNTPLNRSHSELRKTAAEEGDPMTVVLYGIDSDSQRVKKIQDNVVTQLY